MWCFKIVFGYDDIHCDDYFEFHCESATRGHSFKLPYVKDTVVLILELFYRVHCKSVEYIAAGHCKFLLSSFKHSIKLVAFSVFLKCFNHNVFSFLLWASTSAAIQPGLSSSNVLFLLLSLLFCSLIHLNK